MDRCERARRDRRRRAAGLSHLRQGRRLLRLALQLLGQERRYARQPQRPDLVATAITPDYALGGHTASLGLAYYAGKELPAPFQGGMFIGQHGSWNRSEYSGYKVIFVPFKDGRPSGAPIDVLTGFLKDDGSGKAHGRPVGVAIDGKGALLVADDTGNTVWRVTGDQRQSSSVTPGK